MDRGCTGVCGWEYWGFFPGKLRLYLYTGYINMKVTEASSIAQEAPLTS